MHTITSSAVTDVLDYARHSYPLEEDAVICVAFNAQGVPGACARALPTGLGTPVEDLAATMLSTLRQAGITRVVVLFTGQEGEPLRARRLLRLLRRSVEVPTAICLQGFTWHEMDGHDVGAYYPGTSNTGLHTAVHHGAPASAPATPSPSQASTLAEATAPILEHRRAIPVEQLKVLVQTACAELQQLWPSSLSTNPDDPTTAHLLLALNTPGVLSHSLALATLFPATQGPRTTRADILAGMPHGVDLRTANSSDALLRELITRGPAYAGTGPLTALAYSAWLQGRGTRAAGLLRAAGEVASIHEHRSLSAQVRWMQELVHSRVAAHALAPSRRGHR